MSRRRLRDDLRDVFETLSEPAHPALSARIRSELTSRPATAARVPRLAAAVAVLAAILVVASLVFVSHRVIVPPSVPGSQPTPGATAPPTAPPSVPGPNASAQPTPVPGVGGPSAAPSTAASPGASLPPFSCSAQSGPGPTSPPVGVTDVRAGPQGGYDRFVIQFDGSVPQYSVQPQASATFVQDPSGQRVTLSGTAGLLVTVQGARSAGSYPGPTDLKPSGTAVLEEARQVGDFEGVVRWGLGLSHSTCFRAFTLTGPSRIVVDVQN